MSVSKRSLFEELDDNDGAFLRESFRVGPCTVTMTLTEKPPTGGVLPLRCDWFPNPPARLSRSERRQYLKGRQQFITKLADKIAGKILVVDL